MRCCPIWWLCRQLLRCFLVQLFLSGELWFVEGYEPLVLFDLFSQPYILLLQHLSLRLGVWTHILISIKVILELLELFKEVVVLLVEVLLVLSDLCLVLDIVVLVSVNLCLKVFDLLRVLGNFAVWGPVRLVSFFLPGVVRQIRIPGLLISACHTMPRICSFWPWLGRLSASVSEGYLIGCLLLSLQLSVLPHVVSVETLSMESKIALWDTPSFHRPEFSWLAVEVVLPLILILCWISWSVQIYFWLRRLYFWASSERRIVNYFILDSIFQRQTNLCAIMEVLISCQARIEPVGHVCSSLVDNSWREHCLRMVLSPWPYTLACVDTLVSVQVLIAEGLLTWLNIF